MKRAFGPLAIVALLASGCGAATPAPAASPCPAAPVVVSSPPPKVAPAPDTPPTRFTADPTLAACGAAVDLAWLDDVKMLRLATTGHGHHGLSEVHVDLERVYDDVKFRGIVIVSVRHWQYAPLLESKEISLDPAEVDALLSALREGVIAPKTDADVKGVYVHDTSRSEVITLDLMAPRESRPSERKPPHHVQFVVDEGESMPLPWRMRTCAEPFAHAARDTSTQAYFAFLKRLDTQAMFDRLHKQQAKLPRRKTMP